MLQVGATGIEDDDDDDDDDDPCAHLIKHYAMKIYGGVEV
jgi:hypothetical protein